jgi:hypothetical protein
MQGKFHADLSNGIVLGNGISEYDQDPTDPHNRDTLKFMDAIQNEHFAVFEQLWVTQIQCMFVSSITQAHSTCCNFRTNQPTIICSV